MTTVPKWFGKPIPKCDAPRRDFYLCSSCGGQSCGDVYSSICTRCRGISTDPPQGSRHGYLCTSCARNRHVCTCDYPPPPPPPPPTPPTPPVCCCSCSWCNYLCKCVCCCLSCLCQTSSWDYCFTLNCKCPCRSCSCSWCDCSCLTLPES